MKFLLVDDDPDTLALVTAERITMMNGVPTQWSLILDRADADALRSMIERLCAAGMHAAIVTGTHLGNVDGQLRARPTGPGRLFLACNRGSELFAADAAGVTLLAGRTATAEEDAALDRAAALVVAELAGRGLDCEVVTARMNRRKIDLIPGPEWFDPPKARIVELLAAVTERLGRVEIPDLAAIVDTQARRVGAAAAALRPHDPQKRACSGVRGKGMTSRTLVSPVT